MNEDHFHNIQEEGHKFRNGFSSFALGSLIKLQRPYPHLLDNFFRLAHHVVCYLIII